MNGNIPITRQKTYTDVAVVGRHLTISTDEFEAVQLLSFSTWPFVILPWLKHRSPQSVYII